MPPRRNVRKTDAQIAAEQEEAERAARQAEAERQARMAEELRRVQEERAAREAEIAAETERQREVTLRAQAELEQQQRLELERKQRERERELQQMQLLDEKDNEIADLKAKVLQLHKASQAARGDADRETARARDLQDEVDGLRSRVEDMEGSTAKERESLVTSSRSLEKKHETTLKQLQEVTEHLEAEKKKVDAAARTHAQREKELQEKLDAAVKQHDSSESNHMVLVKMATGELESLRAQNAELTRQVAQRERDDTKSTLMLSMQQQQMFTMMDEAKRANEIISGLKDENAALKEKNEELSTRVASFEGDQAAEREAHADEMQRKEVELSSSRAAAAAAQAASERANRALEQLREKAAEDAEKALQRDKEAIAQVSALTSDLTHTKSTLESVREELQRREKELVERTTALQAECEATEGRLRSTTSQLERVESELYSAATQLRSEKESLKHKIEVLEKEMTAAGKQHLDEKASLQGAIERARIEAESEKRAVEQKDRAHFQTEAQRNAEIQSLSAQVAALKQEAEAKQKQYVDETVRLRAEQESAKARVGMHEQELSRERATWEREVTELRTNLQVLKEAAAQATESNRERTEALTAERDALLSQAADWEERLKAAEGDSNRREKDTWDRIAAYKAEVSALKHEVDAHKETIARLETSVGDTFSARVVEDMNAKLQADCDSYRQQVKNLQATITTMQLESEIMDSYKSKVLSESSDAQQRRVAELEREHRLLAPLVSELVSTVRQHDLLTPQLAQQVDAYKAQYNAVLATSNGSSGRAASMESAAKPPGGDSSLPRLTPLARPGSGRSRMS